MSIVDIKTRREKTFSLCKLDFNFIFTLTENLVLP